jgi:hypothetical protein
MQECQGLLFPCTPLRRSGEAISFACCNLFAYPASVGNGCVQRVCWCPLKRWSDCLVRGIAASGRFH